MALRQLTGNFEATFKGTSMEILDHWLLGNLQATLKLPDDHGKTSIHLLAMEAYANEPSSVGRRMP